MTIDRVEKKEPGKYVFPEPVRGSSKLVSGGWFAKSFRGNEISEDRYHIRCTLEEISENDERWNLSRKR